MKYLVAIAFYISTFGAFAQSACGDAGERSLQDIINRYSRFTDSETKQVVSDAAKTALSKNVKDMIQLGGGITGAIEGVKGEVQNNKSQIKTALDAYCKTGAGCSSPESLGWPEKLPSTFNRPVLQRVYVMASLMLELNSLTLLALQQCPNGR